MKKKISLLITMLFIFISNSFAHSINFEQQKSTQNEPYWKTVINEYPSSYNVIAVFEVERNVWINILYSDNGKYYCQTIYPNKKKKDTPDKAIKKGNNTYVIVNQPEGYLKVEQKRVVGMADGIVMETWKRLDQ